MDTLCKSSTQHCKYINANIIMKANRQKSLFQLAALQEELNLERKLVSNAIEKERLMTSKRDDGECYFFYEQKTFSMPWIKCVNANVNALISIT